MNFQEKQYGRSKSTNVPVSAAIFEPSSSTNAKQRQTLIKWLNSVLPDLNLPINASDEEFRAFLVDGTVLCRLINQLKPGSVREVLVNDQSSENIKSFLSAMEELSLQTFRQSDLEKGSMKLVFEGLSTLRMHFMPDIASCSSSGSFSGSAVFDGGRSTQISRTNSNADSRFQYAMRSPLMSEPSIGLLHNGHKFQEVFQLRQGAYVDLPQERISEMMRSNSLDNAPTQSLLSVVSGILDEGVERKNGEIPQRVGCLLKKVVQEIERRISTQAEHLRTQNNLFKSREEKYQSRISVLEAIAAGTNEDTQIAMIELQRLKNEQMKIQEKYKTEEKRNEQTKTEENKNEQTKAEEKTNEQTKIEEKKKLEDDPVRLMEEKKKAEERKKLEEDLVRLMKEKGEINQEIEALKEEKKNEQRKAEEKKKAEEKEKEQKKIEEKKSEPSKTEEKKNEPKKTEEIKKVEEDLARLMKEKSEINKEIEALKQEKEADKKKYEERCLEMEREAKGVQKDLEDRLKEVVKLLTESKNQVKELESFSESKSEDWKKKQNIYQIFTEFQLGALRELRFSSQSVKQEVVKTQKSFLEEFNQLTEQVKTLQHAAQSYYPVLAENRKLHNEVQELKGNIRVYCRIRPLSARQQEKQSIVEYIGDNGELVVVNPSKAGKEGRKMFKFNKVYGPPANQAEIYADIQPLIQSVLDGYNVCIFAYGQTGSGKTYTMMGPNNATEENWGVNYRALNDLFRISQTRLGTFKYEIGVQMVEIYNEQVRDLLSTGGPKKLGIMSTAQPSGLALPDASMFPVNAPTDVLELMDTGLKNRAQASTALNERSSRSHSVVTIHARGTDMKTGSTMRSSLHLVDLAGSERVDRSEVTQDRLKEAQHINKSLAALGDVIFALAQKSSHIPYRNSKLTQVLQSSLGGQAKTLMFVQLNPDITSYSESTSTLKFAERVSGVELGAAKSTKDGRDVRELMEQVASLKDAINKKDEEIERLQLLKDLKNVSLGLNH